MRKALYILGQLDDRDLQWMLDAGSVRSVTAGDDLITVGHTPEALFVLLEGELSVMVNGSEVSRLGVGDIVGEISLLDSRPPVVTLHATRSCLVHEIPFTSLRQELDTNVMFARRFYYAVAVFLADRLLRTDAALVHDPTLTRGSDPRKGVSPEMLELVALAGARWEWFSRCAMRRMEA